MKQFVVKQQYMAAYADPIRFDAGEVVEVQRADAEYPGWYWCRTQSGKEGWVHRAFLHATTGLTHAVRAYSALELSAHPGQRGESIEHLDGWLYVRLDDGRTGWLPVSHVSPVSGPEA
ncbi:MAG: SH3 domain-containing protein [Pseudomonadota bacterium]|nr:SH3 domain-containing protein [Pseudomonadota bacterium]